MLPLNGVGDILLGGLLNSVYSNYDKETSFYENVMFSDINFSRNHEALKVSDDNTTIMMHQGNPPTVQAIYSVGLHYITVHSLFPLHNDIVTEDEQT